VIEKPKMLGVCPKGGGVLATYTKPEVWACRVGEAANSRKLRIEHRKSDFHFMSVFSFSS
jgi:hypothetical protein